PACARGADAGAEPCTGVPHRSALAPATQTGRCWDGGVGSRCARAPSKLRRRNGRGHRRAGTQPQAHGPVPARGGPEEGSRPVRRESVTAIDGRPWDVLASSGQPWGPLRPARARASRAAPALAGGGGGPPRRTCRRPPCRAARSGAAGGCGEGGLPAVYSASASAFGRVPLATRVARTLAASRFRRKRCEKCTANRLLYAVRPAVRG